MTSTSGNRPREEFTRDDGLVRIHDPAGRPRGTGFVADHRGTVVTAHETVDGLSRLVLHAPVGPHRVVTADEVTPLPGLGLALIRTDGLGVPPLPVTARDRVDSGTYVRIAAGRWREARVLGETAATYTATEHHHRIGDVLELAIGTAGRDALRPGGGAAGGPVLDGATGAVLGVLGTALRSGHRDTGFAVPLRCRMPGGGAAEALAELLAVNAATVPAYGPDLNLAGVLRLTVPVEGQGNPAGALAPGVGEPVERAACAAEWTAFEQGPALVLGLVGPPGSGRTTELAALAARRHRAGHPTLWLRGADLRDADASIADAARRALERAAGYHRPEHPGATGPEHPGATGPERLAHCARAAGRPLLLVLDGPEEMPPALARRLDEWTRGTVLWLRETGVRLVTACRAEYWEAAGARFPEELLHRGDGEQHGDGLPACVRLGDLTEDEARQASARHGIPEGALSDADARHPLTLRLLAEVRAACPDAPGDRLERHDVLSSYLDLMCLRIAERLAAGNGLHGTAVRRLAAKVAGQVHEAARRGLVAGAGGLDRESFEELFPAGPAPGGPDGCTGWASAVLAEGLLVPAGPGYRFAHEELADWIQGLHLDLDGALRALVHGRRTAPGGQDDPVPHHRAGPVVEALLLLRRQHGTDALAARLADLVHALDADPGSWWAARLLCLTIARMPDATPYAHVLGLLADRIVAWRQRLRTVPGDLGPAFWTGLRLPLETRFELLRRLLHADGPPCEGGQRYLDAAARLIADDFVAVLPCLVRWFEDERPLPATPHATAATAAQALLHIHRHRAVDTLTEALGHAVSEGAGGRTSGEPGGVQSGRWTGVPDGAADGLGGATGGGLPRALRSASAGVPGAGAWMPTADATGTSAGGRAGGAACAGGEDGVRGVAGGSFAGTAPGIVEAHVRVVAEGPAPVVPEGSVPVVPKGSAHAVPEASAPAFADGRRHGAAGAHPRGLAEVPARGLAGWPAQRSAAVTAVGQGEGSVGSLRRRADQLLTVLAEEEPSAVCRAVDRWAHDERPARRAAAVTYGLRAAPHARDAADRVLLRYAALSVLVRTADRALHGGALALLVRDPDGRDRHLTRALLHFAAGDPLFPPTALTEAPAPDPTAVPHTGPVPHADAGSCPASCPGPDTASTPALNPEPASAPCPGPHAAPALTPPPPGPAPTAPAPERVPRHQPRSALVTHPAPVLDAFRARLAQPGAGEVLRVLLDAATPGLARRIADVVREVVVERPGLAGHTAAYVDRRMGRMGRERLPDHTAQAGRRERPEPPWQAAPVSPGTDDRAVLLPLLTGLLDGGPEPLRAALAGVLADPGTPACRSLRRHLLDTLLAREDDPAVLDAVLRAAARTTDDERRDLVHRTGVLLVRTPDGAARFERALVDLAHQVPGFAAAVTRWLAEAPQTWQAVVGPVTRRTVETLAGPRVPA
ncbi:trypsin-like peptidase domain-containing protein [Streptomyces sp. NPDC005931]|uniref:trypsin-like peptidase domain-containing protein n=1 Tax=Streptomyces sp. NPDC005931 TaxID=3364737 RepID=UPI0036A9053D